MRRMTILLVAVTFAACSEAPPPLPAPLEKQQDLSDAERRAIFDQAEASRRKNSKLTPRSRRFHGDSI